MTKRSPLSFFALVFALSIPFWWIGSVSDLQLMPDLLVSVLMAFYPMHASDTCWLLMLLPVTSWNQRSACQATTATALWLTMPVIVGALGHSWEHGCHEL